MLSDPTSLEQLLQTIERMQDEIEGLKVQVKVLEHSVNILDCYHSPAGVHFHPEVYAKRDNKEVAELKAKVDELTEMHGRPAFYNKHPRHNGMGF